MGEEGKILYNYLLDDKAYEEKIVRKISEQNLTQDEFEILLYSFRFIFNSQINDVNCFYNEILKKNASNFIQNNFIPSSYPLSNEYLKSYNILKERLEKHLEVLLMKILLAILNHLIFLFLSLIPFYIQMKLYIHQALYLSLSLSLY